MKEKHIVAGLLFICCAALVAMLTLVPKGGLNSDKKELTEQQSGEMFVADFVSIITKAKEPLSDIEKAFLTEQDQIAGEADTTIAFDAAHNLIHFWDSLERFDISGFYYNRLYERNGSEFNLMNASQRFYEQGRIVADSAARQYYMSTAEKGFKKAYEMNPKNLDAKVGRALCIVENRNRIMEGVPLLREVLQADSNNIMATYTLGLLQIESGQLEKALVSFEKLVSLQPFNGEFYFYLADVQQKTGNTKQAVLNYEKAKMLAPNDETRHAIDDILKEIK